MKNILKIFSVNPATYILILSFLFTGLIKNIILIYLIILVHELGHIFIIKLLKYSITKVEIYPMGGVTSINKKINTPLKHELLISISGIIFQIILSFIFKYLFVNSLISLNTYMLFNTYNKTILIFNLIPIIPLDGYIFLKSILEIFFSFKLSFYISFIVSILSIILFITYNQIYSLNNYLIISFLIYKIFVELKDFKFKYWKFQLERYLFDLKYKNIKYEKNVNINKLKKDTYHYFKTSEKVISEKKLLSRKFNKTN